MDCEERRVRILCFPPRVARFAFVGDQEQVMSQDPESDAIKGKQQQFPGLC